MLLTERTVCRGRDPQLPHTSINQQASCDIGQGCKSIVIVGNGEISRVAVLSAADKAGNSIRVADLGDNHVVAKQGFCFLFGIGVSN